MNNTLFNHRLAVDQFLRDNSSNVEDLFKNIDKILMNDRPKAKSSHELPKLITLIGQLDKLRTVHENLDVFVNDKLEYVKVLVEDAVGKKQHFVLNVEQDGKFGVKEHSLPDMIALTPIFNDLITPVNTFLDYVHNLSDYFQLMSDLDEYCWVIDPANPTSKDNFRRIIIGNDVSMVVTVDCQSSEELPRVALLGPSALTDPLMQRVHQYGDSWNPLRGINNFLDMLGLDEFPQKTELMDSATENAEIECAICLSSRDASGRLPAVVCDRESCRLHYHEGCLYQWLLAVNGNVQTFSVIKGECPTCSSPICCPFVEIT